MDFNEFVKEFENNELFRNEVLDYMTAGPGMEYLPDMNNSENYHFYEDEGRE